MPASKINQKLTLPQLRILKYLAEIDAREKSLSPDLVGWITRKQIAHGATVSESMTGNLGPVKGDPKETSSHYGRKNLIDLGYVVSTIIDIDDYVRETVYRITELGIRAYQAHVARHGRLRDTLPPSVCTNDRYRRADGSASDVPE